MRAFFAALVYGASTVDDTRSLRRSKKIANVDFGLCIHRRFQFRSRLATQATSSSSGVTQSALYTSPL